MRRHGRADANQSEIVHALRAAGRSVQVLSSVGNGCPDLLVGWPGHSLLIECKTAGGKLTREQERWMRLWKGPVAIARNARDALLATGVLISAGNGLAVDSGDAGGLSGLRRPEDTGGENQAVLARRGRVSAGAPLPALVSPLHDR